MTLLFSFIRILLRKIRLILSKVNCFGYTDIFISFIVFVKSSKQFFKLLLYEKEKQKGNKNDKIIIMHNCMVMHQSS